VLAADGQDPPEALPAMLEQLEHADVVWGRRRGRTNDGRRVRLTAAAHYRLFRLLTGLDYPPSGLDFFVARRRVVEAVLAGSGRHTSLHLQIYNLGFRQAFVDYERGVRAGGCSKWTFRKRARLAVDMLTAVSAAPVRLVCLAGLAVAAAGAAGLLSAVLVTSLVGAALLMAVALLGEYVWRTLDEVRGAPPYIEGRRERV
jgi:dolichol-phosphate mannosyltransferase